MCPMRFSNDLDSFVQVFQMTLTLSLRYNIRPNGKADTLTLHGACPVLYGTKWGGSILFIALLDKWNSLIFFQWRTNENQQEFSNIVFFPQWQTNGSVREPRSGGGLVHSPRIKSCDRSLCDTFRCCLYELCARRIKRASNDPKRLFLQKSKTYSYKQCLLK